MKTIRIICSKIYIEIDMPVLITIKHCPLSNLWSGCNLSEWTFTTCCLQLAFVTRAYQEKSSSSYSFCCCGDDMQTWNLSKNLHRRIFRLKILHRQFYLISTVLVRKKHKKWVKMEKFTLLAKILHCRWHWQIPPLAIGLILLSLSPSFLSSKYHLAWRRALLQMSVPGSVVEPSSTWVGW